LQKTARGAYDVYQSKVKNPETNPDGSIKKQFKGGRTNISLWKLLN